MTALLTVALPLQFVWGWWWRRRLHWPVGCKAKY